MEFPGSLSPSAFIVHHSSQVLLTVSSVHAELMIISPCWSGNTGTSKYMRECRLRFRNYFYGSALHIWFVLLGWFMRWKVSGWTVVLWGRFPEFFQNIAYHSCVGPTRLFLHVFCKSRWCIHIVVLTQLLLGINPVLFYQLNNLSIAVDAFQMLKLLPSYMNWLTNFRSLSLNVVVTPYCLKHMNSVLFAFT